MLLSKAKSALTFLARPENLWRLGLMAFLVTVLYFRLPVATDQISNPPAVGAVSCSGGKCESAGHCWDQGTTGYDGGSGCKYKCSGGSWKDEDCNTSQAEKDKAKADKKAYDDQVASSGGGGGGGGSAQTGVGVSGGNSCGSGSASGCSQKSFYSQPSGAPADWVCFPNGVNQQGVTVCGRGPKSGGATYTDSNGVQQTTNAINTVVDPYTGKPVGGSVIKTNAANGGCGVVVQCGCSTGMQSLCMGPGQAPSDPAAYCASKVCSPIGVNGKKCTPGQVVSCNGTMGEVCNNSGTDTYPARAHACGATHTVAYSSISSISCFYTPPAGVVPSEETCADYGGAKANGVTYNNLKQCEDIYGEGNCSRGVAQISQSTDLVNAYCESECRKTTGIDINSCKNSCSQQVNTPGSTIAQAYSAATQNAQTSGTCIPGGTYKIFKGCGAGSQAEYNCYAVCKDGAASTQCWNEPGLSCGAKQKLTPTQQAIVDVISSRTTVNPTPPPPTPTPKPKAACGESCGNGVSCTGSNIACVNGTCRSTECSVEEQNNQCVCQPPPPVAPMCIDIWASKATPVLGDEVTFTCAQVNNTERYEFRYGFTTSKTGVSDLQLFDLAPSSATSNVSQPITVDKIGRYVAQCRPCGPNDLCQEWEPLDGQIGPPELPPEGAQTSGIQATPTPTPTPTAEPEEEATESGTQQ